MKWGWVLATVGVLCSAIGMRAMALCGPVTFPGQTCGPVWNTFCPSQGCQKVETTNRCPDGEEYNAVLQGPARYMGVCSAPTPPNPDAECTASCQACSDDKFMVPDSDPLWRCLPEYRVCGVTIVDQTLRCQ